MDLHQRAYRGQNDWQAIAELIGADTLFHHQIDFPWRLCSTSLEDARNAAVWEDEQGVMRVFAALHFPWLTVDYAIHPNVRTWELEAQVLNWSETRLQQIAVETNDSFPFNVSVGADEAESILFLEKLGYTRWENYMVVMTRALTDIPASKLPPGFSIRSFGGASEVEQYAELQRKAFDSTTMTPLWRSHSLQAPLYNPDLDLVAVAPNGRLAGFCIWWYQPTLKTAQIEPLGVHPDFQNLGLSQALMNEGLRRIAAHGANKAQVETYSFSDAALNAYAAAGFQVITHELKFYKEYQPD